MGVNSINPRSARAGRDPVRYFESGTVGGQPHPGGEPPAARRRTRLVQNVEIWGKQASRWPPTMCGKAPCLGNQSAASKALEPAGPIAGSGERTLQAGGAGLTARTAWAHKRDSEPRALWRGGPRGGSSYPGVSRATRKFRSVRQAGLQVGEAKVSGCGLFWRWRPDPQPEATTT